MAQASDGPAFKEKFGRWSAVVWENEREDGSPMLTGKISRTRKAEQGFKEEYTFFAGERSDYRRAFEAIDHYMSQRLQELKDGAYEREPGQEG